MEEKKQNYISLQEATKFCSYSQKYLNLRVRQKKIKAVKIGRNWVTTKEWIDEYAKIIENGNGNHNGHKTITDKKYSLSAFQNKFILNRRPLLALSCTAVFVCLSASIFFNKNEISLGIKNASDYYSKNLNKISYSVKNNFNNFYELVVESKEIFGSTANSFAIEYKGAVSEPFSEINGLIINSYASLNEITLRRISQASLSVLDSNKNDKKGFPLALFFAEIRENTDGYRNWVNQEAKERIVFIKNEILQANKKLATTVGLEINLPKFNFSERILKTLTFMQRNMDELSKNIVAIFQNNKIAIEDISIPQEKNKEGLVVVPSTKKNEAKLKQIEKSFSDEVKVEMKNDNTGIIKPVFKNDNSQEYLYLLVPIQETN